jgi:hypothetical protein
MKIDAGYYVPALKWRQGEYQSLLKLESSIKDRVVPLLIIPPQEYDFEEQEMKKTVHEHIETFPKRLKSKWGARLAFLDIHESLEGEVMNDGRPVIDYLLQESKAFGGNVRPVVSLKKGPAYLASVKSYLSSSGQGVVLRVKLEELMSPAVNAEASKLLSYLNISWPEVDLIFDLGNPGNFEPYNVFAGAISGAILRIVGCGAARSKIILATSLKLSDVKKPGGVLLRHEWCLYREMRAELGKYNIVPCFGDYTIETPDFAPGMDMRMAKPGGKIVYTTIDSWIVPKGGAFRNDASQMIGHCIAVMSSGHFMGRSYSKADERIENTANKVENCGNLSTWKFVGVNHHITFVVRQLASQYGI